jgi:hypothetical protein
MFDRLKIQTLAWLGGVLLHSAGLAAQTPASIWLNIDDLRSSDAALTGHNAAGLHRLPVASLSYAELTADQTQGNFINYYQSNNSLTLSAGSESFYRLNPQTVFYGQIRYSHFQGQNMEGSMLTDPYSHAFDIIEISPESAGDKVKEHYLLTGAIAHNLSERWILGGKVNYEASNYTKHKDLRHTNSLLDLTASLGIDYILSPRIELGINYLYRKAVEGLSFKTYGLTDRQYTSLIAFGNFFGTSELFGGEGYTDSSTSNPIIDHINGASLQLHLRPDSEWTLFSELSCQIRHGLFGKRSTTTPVYSKHFGRHLTLRQQLSHHQGQHRQHRHDWNLSIEHTQLENHENIWRKENNTGNRTDIVYYGSNQVLDKHQLHLNLAYTANLHLRDLHPEWKLRAETDLSRRQQTLTLYPFYRKQEIYTYKLLLSAERRILKHHNRYDFHLAAGYGNGNGAAAIDGHHAAGQTQGKSSDTHLYREHEYLTAPRLTARAAIAYNRPLADSLRGYLRLSYEYLHAPRILYLNGHTHHTTTLSLGCLF